MSRKLTREERKEFRRNILLLILIFLLIGLAGHIQTQENKDVKEKIQFAK